MGSCMSSKLGSSSWISSSSSSSTTVRSSIKYGKVVRVVHLNGWLEEFEDPVTVKQVTGNQPKHFVFPQARLLSLDSKPMDSAAQLELGNIYFLLPHSIFQAEMSPMDLATIYKRLTSAAHKPPNRITADNNNNNNNNNNNVVGAADTSTTAAEGQKPSKLKPNRYADRYVPPRITTTPSEHMFNNCDDGLVRKQHQVCDQSPRTWKPILESITERSFTLTSTESDDSSHQDTRR